jgi:hypothetical protein
MKIYMRFGVPMGMVGNLRSTLVAMENFMEIDKSKDRDADDRIESSQGKSVFHGKFKADEIY